MGEPVKPVYLVDFEDFKSKGCYAKYSTIKLFNFKAIDYPNSLIVFISHTWLRPSRHHEDYDEVIGPFPDDFNNNNYRLCVRGIEKLKSIVAPAMAKCYIWLDFSCFEQDGADLLEELKNFPTIVGCCDCIFTPIYGLNQDPDADPIPKWYLNYNDVHAWNNQKYGYINRSWTRLEMFFAANVPVLQDPKRIDKLLNELQSGARPHYIYGTRELVS